MSELHVPVLMREAIDALRIKADGIYVDATLGRAGHASKIVERLGEHGRLFGFDRDPEAIKLARSKFTDDARVTLIHSRFSDMLAQLPVDAVDGVLMDLGVSSPQLDQAGRGFSFMRDGVLDMRMDTTQGETASQWLARVDEGELVKVLFELGEERFARRIARAIVEKRATESIESTHQLAAIIESATPKKDKNKHPATRTFQAIRLHINQELFEVTTALPQALKLLRNHGRLVVISFHSLEDRIVKRFIRQHATPNLPPKSIPVTDDAYLTPLKAVGRAIKPSSEEVARNPRARSSVMRVAERTEVPLPSTLLTGGACA